MVKTTSNMTIEKAMKQVIIICISLLCVPFSVGYLVFNYACLALQRQTSLRHRLRNSTGFRPKNILVTGICNAQGLRVARALHETTGHNIIGADLEPWGIPSHGRFSNSLKRFRRLNYGRHEEVLAAYTREILYIIEKESIDLWISCTSQPGPVIEAQARYIIEQKTTCVCFTLSLDDSKHFHSRNGFLSFTHSVGLPVPETHQVKSRDEIHNVLNSAQGKRRYTLNAPEDTNATWPRTVLPRRTISQTYHEVSQVKIKKTAPWLLEQHIDGLNSFTTFSIIVRGKVKAFAASSQSVDAKACKILAPSSALNQCMLRFVQSFAQNMSTRSCAHLTVDFCIDERATSSGVEQTILPVNGQIRSHPIALFFDGFSGSINLARAYTSLLVNTSNGLGDNAEYFKQNNESISLPTNSSAKIYSFGNDVVYLLLQPLLDLLKFRIQPIQFLRSLVSFAGHLGSWKETIYDFRDPLPFWWLYQVYVPLQLLVAVFGRRNVMKQSQLYEMM